MRQAPRDRRDGPNPSGRFDRLRGAGPPAAATEPVVQHLPAPRAGAALARRHLSTTRTVGPRGATHPRDLDGRLATGFAPDTRCPAVHPGAAAAARVPRVGPDAADRWPSSAPSYPGCRCGSSMNIAWSLEWMTFLAPTMPASVTSRRRARPRSLLLVVAAWRAQRSVRPTERALRYHRWYPPSVALARTGRLIRRRRSAR